MIAFVSLRFLLLPATELDSSFCSRTVDFAFDLSPAHAYLFTRIFICLSTRSQILRLTSFYLFYISVLLRDEARSGHPGCSPMTASALDPLLSRPDQVICIHRQ